jgi:glycosyl transferase, family 25
MEDISAVVFINLDRRTDRLEEITGEFARMGIENAIRFPAVEHKVGAVGCMKSHLAVLKMAKANNWTNVLIFEDDFLFVVDKPTFHASLKIFFRMKMPYDVLMLSYNLREYQEINGLVGYARRAFTSAGYIIHNRIYDDLIALFEQNIPLLEAEPDKHYWYALDACWRVLQATREWLYFKKRIGIQRPGFSDIEQRDVSYGV